MRLLVSSFFSSHPIAVLCLAVLFSNNAVFTRPVLNQELGHLLSPDLSPAIHLSEIRDTKGQGTGVRFLEIGPKCFCKNQQAVADSDEPPTAMPGSKPIGYAYFESEAHKDIAFAEARAYAERFQYSKLEPGPFDDLTYLDDVMEYLHMTSGVIDDYTMEFWKGELKALGGENAIPNEHTHQKLADSNISELSPPILLSELLDNDGKGTGARFLMIGRQHFCKDKAVGKSEQPPTPALSPELIGFVDFSTEEEGRTALAEARAYAGGVRYPTPKSDPLNYLTFLDNFMEHLHNRTPRAIDEHTMKLWKEKLKELKSLDGERIILNEYMRLSHPTGHVAMQIGDNVLSLATTPTDRYTYIQGVILGSINLKDRIDLDEVHKHAKSHSDYCGTEDNVKRFEAIERFSKSGKMFKALAQWKYANSVMDILVTQKAVSKETFGVWVELCPERMDATIKSIHGPQYLSSASQNSDPNPNPKIVDPNVTVRREEDKKRLEALSRGGRRYSYSAYLSHALIGNLEIIFNELLKSKNPTGTVSVQFGDEVLSFDAFPTATEGNERIRFESLGSVNRDVSVNFDKVRKNAKSHSKYCGTTEDVATFMAFEEKSRQLVPSSRAKITIAQWKFAISVIDDLGQQGFLSREALEKWAKLCPKRLHGVIHYINRTNGVDRSAKRTAGQTGSAATSRDPKRQRQNYFWRNSFL
ncbi:hypothetical protein EV361DRAFT_890653 [Lentinula raphanica]|nr:hypothetical protein EV361DRAFT_890653 [Lentinula raphanica]